MRSPVVEHVFDSIFVRVVKVHAGEKSEVAMLDHVACQRGQQGQCLGVEMAENGVRAPPPDEFDFFDGNLGA